VYAWDAAVSKTSQEASRTFFETFEVRGRGKKREKKLTCSACNENAELESKHVVPYIFGLA
jgi:hypothetical protein